MAIYRIPAPDGHTYEIEGPENASQADVEAAVLKQHPRAGSSSSFWNAVGEGVESVRNAVASPFKKAFDVAGWLDQNYPLPFNAPRTKEQAERRANTYSHIVGDTILSAPLIGAGSLVGSTASRALGGAVPKLLPAAGRVGASSVIGAGQAAEKGESPSMGALLGAAGGLVGEGAGAGINALIKARRLGLREFLPSWMKRGPSKLEVAERELTQATEDNFTKTLANDLRDYFGIKSDVSDYDVIRQYAGRKLGDKMSDVYKQARSIVGDATKTNPALGKGEYTIGQMFERLGKLEAKEATGDPFAIARTKEAREFIASWLNDALKAKAPEGIGKVTTNILDKRQDIQLDRKTIKAYLDSINKETGGVDPRKLVQKVNTMKGAVAPGLVKLRTRILSEWPTGEEIVNRYVGSPLISTTGKVLIDSLLANPDTRPLGLYLAARVGRGVYKTAKQIPGVGLAPTLAEAITQQ